MGLIGKLQAETLIMTSADKFHEIFWCRPHHISNVCPTKIQKVHLHEGEWGTSGSVIQWHYNIDGNDHIAKEIVEAIDEENKSVTFKVIEGDLMKEYKSFRIIVQAIPKGDATFVHWTLEYEKLNKDVPAPIKILGFVVHVSEDIDDHLVQA
ncbi:MLP-like protein 34 [Vitis vinifera]|uniref:MLP-like protein 34 n=1 Tax=Vitis vinifera TaxID=29760 RepID=A0A438JUJ6_VITVI|nr:MLP-like protein 34 [Vitis vinifera]